MWLSAEYEASALFSLKPATATASGGKTLLVPTPFAIKMALLDVACRLEGQPAAARAWDDWLAGSTIALRPAREVVVNNTFMKVQKPWEFKGKKEEKPLAIEKARQERKYPFQPNISYTEYAQLAGRLGIAIELSDDTQAGYLTRWLLNVNYLGKRGSFIQLQDVPQLHDELPEGFTVIGGTLAEIPIDALLTQLDDVGEGLTFTRANIYSGAGSAIRLGKHRILRHVALPYELVSSSRGYSYYRLQDNHP